ncbi:MAG: ATP-binding cassette domain-containing protein, partial [Planctomycetes bacterium]|nr:ATP-binding cassette domain-containing protein [Planctomycetota bacterium]
LRVDRLELAPGERVGCVGPSGSGKSTLLDLMAGNLSPTRGRVTFGGQDWARGTPADIQRRRLAGVGLVFQGFELLGALSLLDNVLLPLRFLGLSLDRARALELLERLNLADRALEKPGRVSFGERQRAAICRALIAKPALILADEPTANLDPENAERVLDLLFDYGREENATLFLISHDREHPGRMDRVIAMHELAQGVHA